MGEGKEEEEDNSFARPLLPPTSFTLALFATVQSEKECIDVLTMCLANNLCVAPRGTQHSMGGQSTPSNKGVSLDMKYLRGISYDPSTEEVTCGPGVLWSDLIVYLDRYGRGEKKFVASAFYTWCTK